MARIDVVKAKIEIFKTILITVFFGTLAALLIFNMQTSGVYGVYVVSAMVIIGISAISFVKTLRSLLEELEKL